MSFHRVGNLALILALLPWGGLRSGVVVNEVMPRGSERLLRWGGDGVPRLGYGSSWYEGAYNDGTWLSGNGPFGFGTFPNVSPAPTFGTNMATLMQNITPTMYLRKTFTASVGQATSTDALTLEVQYNDGFVAYLNGVEVARRNAGPVKDFKYRDSVAAMGTPSHTESTTTPYARTEVISLGAANTRLGVGNNILAVHVLNHWENTALHNTTNNSLVGITNVNNLLFKGDLKLTGAALVANNTAWKYLPGVVEPSGGVYDPTLIFQAKQNVPWGRQSFDDSLWSVGAAPFGAGTPPGGVTLGTNLTSQIPGKSVSLYCRIVFSATATDLADVQPLQLLVDWDDGFVAYLNGVEVARDRMDLPNSFTPHDAVASSARGPGTFGTYTLAPPVSHLINGQNVLAVQVHNLTLADADLFMRAQLRTNPAGTNRTLVAPTATWSYYVGLDEPVAAGDENIEDNPEAPDASPDWLELHNNGVDPVSLAGWRLSDDPEEPAKWSFPAGASIPAGGHLVVFCDDLNIIDPAPGGYYHTNFKLSSTGDTVVLSDAAGVVVDSFAYTEAANFESHGRDGGGAWVYQQTPSPGSANSGAVLTGKVAAVSFSEPPGFYPSTRSLTLSCATAGATIRYTLDGTEPSDVNGTVGTAASITVSRSIRARAFKAGLLPSAVATGTYLINEPAGRLGVPAVCLVGDEQKSIYRPHGLMAIGGGAFTNFVAPAPTGNNGIWSQAGPGVGAVPDLMGYNNVIHRGRFTEKPVNLEILRADGTPGPNTEFGFRISGSPHARPRYRLTIQNRAVGAVPGPNDGAWSVNDFTQKPSFNFYFRNDLGGDPLEYPLFPNYPVNAFHDVRVRAGKNDPFNPFIEDEYMRRLFISTGQQGSRGMINTLYINGVYKGFYNLCEHVREDFLQRHHGGSAAWDVRQVATVSAGDGLSFQEMITFIRSSPQSVLVNYQGMKQRLDVVNFADYLITNLMGNTGDWPHNNFVAAKERTVNGRYRYYLWDGEGAFGDFGGTVRTNMFTAGTTGSIVSTSPQTIGLAEGIRVLYTLLRASPEFKLLFADRLQKHFFNNGAFTEGKMLQEWDAMKAEFAPLIAPTAVIDRVTPWVLGVGDATRFTNNGATNSPSRRNVLFNGYYDDSAGGAFIPGHLVTEGMWPVTKTPTFSHYGGGVSPGLQLSMTNPNAGGTIYYTVDGTDPRAEGGAVQGVVYTSPLVMNFPRTIKARAMSAGGEWSPMVEAFYDTGNAEPLMVSELMYHPADSPPVDGDEYEFLEIKNLSTDLVPLTGMSFSAGITYSFPAGSTLAPNARLVLVKNATRFSERYPAVTVFGSYAASGTSLSNSGETLTLKNALDRTVFSMTYTDKAPWPTSPDGGGRSLVPSDPNNNPNASDALNWRESTNLNGSPGADDPSPVKPIHVSEIMANSPGGTGDWVELYNPNAEAVNLAHWWLSDDNAVPKKYRFPIGITIAPGGYLSVTQTQLSAGLVPFTLNPTGETIRLSSGNAAGSLLDYVDTWTFGATEVGKTAGRYTTSSGNVVFVPLVAPTPNAANDTAIIGPVVITEVMYNPSAGKDEFIEIRNTSSAPVPLFDPANPSNTYRLEGVTYSFPTGVTLQPGQIVLLSQLAPVTFRTRYSLHANIAVYGPYSGALHNDGEVLRLQRPTPPVLNDLGATVVPYVDVDAVNYDDVAPWPTSPDGTGPSLGRVQGAAFGNEPSNWQASAAAGGTIGYSSPVAFAAWQDEHFPSGGSQADLQADPDGDGIENFREWAHGLDPDSPDSNPITTTTASAAGQTYLQLHIRCSRSAVGLQVFADTSTSLAPGSWNLGSGQSLGTTSIHPDGTETVTFRHPVPIGSTSTPHYFRGRLVLPP